MFLYSVVQSNSEKQDISKEGGFPSGEKWSKKLEGLKMIGMIQSTAVSPTTMPDPGSSLR